MRMIICHLSDMHFKHDKQNFLLEKEIKLAEAIRSSIDFVSSSTQINNVFFIITGDIAFSGKSEEYNIALDFIMKLQNYIQTEIDGINIEYIVTPGNHDCNFDVDDSVRRTLLDSIRFDKEIDCNFIENCTKVQNDFDDFATLLNNKYISSTIQTIYGYEFSDKKVAFQVFNSSWMSKKNEVQGQIILPLNQMEEICLSHYDLVVSLFHHPLNWIESNNKIAFKELIERTSDIIITGHEHNMEIVETITKDKYNNKYISGGELQDNYDSQNSKFNLIAIDINEEKEIFLEYRWNGEMYVPVNNGEWYPFSRNRYIDSKRIYINQEFKKKLNDPGIKLTKKEKDTIYLTDIYVYPNFERVPNKEINDENSSKFDDIKSSESEQFILDTKKILIVGEEKSGKTALGQITYQSFLSNKIIPIFVNATNIKFRNEDNFKNQIYKVFEEQYSQNMVEKYKQLRKKDRAIIIDDFHKISLNEKGRSLLLSLLKDMFGRIVILMEDDLMLQEIIRSRESNKYLDEYEKCRIKEFGHSLRSELIKKWNSIGISSIDKEILDISHKCIEMENKIDTAIGNNLLPKYPVFVLLILQQFETTKKLDTSISTYGYLYESLITKQLFDINQGTDDIDMNSKYLSELAYYMFNNKVIDLFHQDIEEITQKYNEKYSMNLREEILLKKYIDAEIIDNERDKFKFRYKYMYYYFVAKHFKDEIDSSYIRSHIDTMASKLHTEEYANIILFLCHLTRDSYVINRVLKSAKEIFNEFEPYDFSEHKDFIINMYEKIPEFIYHDTEPEENRRALLESKDELATSYNESDDEYIEEVVDEDVNNLLEINRSYKTLQILGQIVKNFPGSLIGNIKYEIIKECYHLGLRTINVFMSLIDYNVEDMIKEIKELYLEKNKNTEHSEEYIEREVKRFILWLSEMIAISVIKKISESVNNSKLNEIYKQAVKENKTISFKMIDISVKLDLLKRLPESEIIDLHNELKKNQFTQNILKQIVLLNFYLYRYDESIKQRICDKLGISYRRMKLKEIKQIISES